MSQNPTTSKRVRFGDPDFESTTLLQWEEEAEGDKDISEEETVDEDYYEESEHDTGSEVELGLKERLFICVKCATSLLVWNALLKFEKIVLTIFDNFVPCSFSSLRF